MYASSMGFKGGIQLGVLHSLFNSCSYGYGYSPMCFSPMGMSNPFGFGFSNMYFNPMSMNSCFNFGFPSMYFGSIPTFNMPLSYSYQLGYMTMSARLQQQAEEQKALESLVYSQEELATTRVQQEGMKAVDDWRKSSWLTFDPEAISKVTIDETRPLSTERRTEVKVTADESSLTFGSKTSAEEVPGSQSSSVDTQSTQTTTRRRLRRKPAASATSTVSEGISATTPQGKKSKSTSPVEGADPRFEKYLDCILKREGGYADSKYDRGGKTNYGITHKTYDAYREKKGLPKREVRQITMEEVRDIYYNEYYLASGANKIADPKMGLYVFDVAVNSGPETAKKFYRESGGDLKKFEELREKHYRNIVDRDNKKSKAEGEEPTQWRNLDGWLNRIKEVRDYAMNELTGLDTIA